MKQDRIMSENVIPSNITVLHANMPTYGIGTTFDERRQNMREQWASEVDHIRSTVGDGAHYILRLKTCKDGAEQCAYLPGYKQKYDFGAFCINCKHDCVIEEDRYGQMSYAPKWSDIFDDLIIKQSENAAEFDKMFALMKRMYECLPVSDDEIDALHFSNGIPTDFLLHLMRRLLLEEDINYPTGMGRTYPWSHILNQCCPLG